jgi:hypothetical protein
VSDLLGQRRPRAWLRRYGVVVVPCVLFGAFVIWFFLPAKDPSDLTTRLPPTTVLFELLGIGFSIRAATHPTLDRRARLPWRLMIVCFMVHFASGVAFGMAAAAGRSHFTSIVTVGYGLRLTMVAVLLAILFSFAAKPLSLRGWLKVAFDVTTVVGGGAMALWYLLVGPALTAQDRGPLMPLIILVTVAVGDLILVLGVAIVLFRGVAATAHRPVSALLLSILSYLGLDLYIAFNTSNYQLPPINPVWTWRVADVNVPLAMVS